MGHALALTAVARYYIVQHVNTTSLMNVNVVAARSANLMNVNVVAARSANDVLV